MYSQVNDHEDEQHRCSAGRPDLEGESAYRDRMTQHACMRLLAAVADPHDTACAQQFAALSRDGSSSLLLVQLEAVLPIARSMFIRVGSLEDFPVS